RSIWVEGEGPSGDHGRWTMDGPWSIVHRPRSVRQRRLQPVPALAQVAVDFPEAPQGTRQAERYLLLATLDSPAEGGAHVVMLHFNSRHPFKLVRPYQLVHGGFRQPRVVEGVAALKRLG